MEPVNKEKIMKQKVIFLLFLYCPLIISASITQNKIQEYRTGKVVIIQDTVPTKEAIRIVEDFYRTYMASFLSDLPSNGNLNMEKYLTRRLIDKINRMRSVIGADPVIRAQDVNQTAFETLKVKPLGNNWYMVNYRWNMNDEKSNTSIPLKVSIADGRYMIDYITPEWNGSLYGDNLLCKNRPLRPTIGGNTPLSMMETFYTAYTSLYSSMPEELGRQLKELRDVHLTSNALNQFEEAVNEYQLDGLRDYDLLIDNFDFDCLWLSSITYTLLTENSFQVSYKQGDLVRVIVLTLTKSDGEYKIDNIRIGK